VKTSAVKEKHPCTKEAKMFRLFSLVLVAFSLFFSFPNQAAAFPDIPKFSVIPEQVVVEGPNKAGHPNMIYTHECRAEWQETDQESQPVRAKLLVNLAMYAGQIEMMASSDILYVVQDRPAEKERAIWMVIIDTNNQIESVTYRLYRDDDDTAKETIRTEACEGCAWVLEEAKKLKDAMHLNINK
jgi:hypothetical protein